MTDKTLKNARGLNSIADPRSFKGSSGRQKVTRVKPVVERVADTPEPEPAEEPDPVVVTQPVSPVPELIADETPKLEVREQRLSTNHKRRVRRELTVPAAVADLIEASKINPADILNQAYLHHRGAVRSGELGRSVAKGRKRLRVSMTNGEFDRIAKLADFRGWNRSETVAVLVAAELGPGTTETLQSLARPTTET